MFLEVLDMKEKKGVKNIYKFFITLSAVVAFVVISLFGAVVLQSKKAVLEKSVGSFKMLSVREVFENNFKDVKVQVGVFSNPRITGLDEMKNVYTLEIQKNGDIKLFINGAAVQMPVDQQYAEWYKNALLNFIKNNPPEDYKTTKPDIIFEHMKDYNEEYVFDNDKEYIVLKGRSDTDDIEMWFLFKRVNNKLKFFVDRVFTNGTELSGFKKTAFLASIYQVEKKTLKMNLIDIVKSSKLVDFPDVELSSVFDNLKNVRWTVKDEDKNLVECTAVNEVGNAEESIDIGFKLREDGYVDLEYFYLNGTELKENEVYSKIRSIYKQFGKFDEKQYVQDIIEKIKASKIPEKDKTIGDFLEETKNLYEFVWNHSFVGRNTEVILKGSSKSANRNFEIRFLFAKGELYISKSYLNGKEFKPSELFVQLEKTEGEQVVQNVGDNNVDNNLRYIELVKNSSIVSNSQYKTNLSAFKSFLSNPVWSYNEKNKRVILTGSGKYGGKSWNFKFVFEIPVPNKVLLEYAYANNIEMVDEVRDYVISKVFKVSKIGENLSTLVRNTVFKKKTYGEILGTKGWTIDRTNDLVVYSNGKLRVLFFVQPNGAVNVSDFYYAGKRYSKEAMDLLLVGEQGNGVLAIQKALEQRDQISAKKLNKTSTPTSIQSEVTSTEELPEVLIDEPLKNDSQDSDEWMDDSQSSDEVISKEYNEEQEEQQEQQEEQEEQQEEQHEKPSPYQF